MQMPSLDKAAKTIATGGAPRDRARIKRMLAAMEAFMAADSASDRALPAQRAA